MATSNNLDEVLTPIDEFTDSKPRLGGEKRDYKRPSRWNKFNLTMKQIKFAEAYIRTGGLYKAYAESLGIKDHNIMGTSQGYRALGMLRNRNIQSYIRWRQRQLIELTNTDTAWIVDKLKEIVAEGGPDRMKAMEMIMRIIVPVAETKAAESNTINISFEKVEQPNE